MHLVFQWRYWFFTASKYNFYWLGSLYFQFFIHHPHNIVVTQPLLVQQHSLNQVYLNAIQVVTNTARATHCTMDLVMATTVKANMVPFLSLWRFCKSDGMLCMFIEIFHGRTRNTTVSILLPLRMKTLDKYLIAPCGNVLHKLIYSKAEVYDWTCGSHELWMPFGKKCIYELGFVQVFCLNTSFYIRCILETMLNFAACGIYEKGVAMMSWTFE